ncbi:MAG TPA: hypothetical protein VGB97_04655 [Candidatus Paceibacterota bacterium]|jgi:hypothetical protein
MNQPHRGFTALTIAILLGILVLLGGVAATIALKAEKTAVVPLTEATSTVAAQIAPEENVEARVGIFQAPEVTSPAVITPAAPGVDLKASCVTQEARLYQKLLSELPKPSVATLDRQRSALLKALYPDSMPATTEAERASLTSEQRQAVASKDSDAITTEIDEVAYSREKLEQQVNNIDRLFDPYSTRLRCGQVTTEEQIAHELKRLADEIERLNKF